MAFSTGLYRCISSFVTRQLHCLASSNICDPLELSLRFILKRGDPFSRRARYETTSQPALDRHYEYARFDHSPSGIYVLALTQSLHQLPHAPKAQLPFPTYETLDTMSEKTAQKYDSKGGSKLTSTPHGLSIGLTLVAWFLLLLITVAGTPIIKSNKTPLSDSQFYFLRINGTEVASAPGKQFYFGWSGFCVQDDLKLLGGQREMKPPK